QGLCETAYTGDWSPDGKRITFTSVLCGGSSLFDVFVGNSDGSGVYDLTQDEPGFSDEGGASWSPDGTKIVYDHNQRGDPNVDIAIRNADGSGRVSLIATA